MVSGVSLIGFAAAICTTASYVPQIYKCWTTGEAKDLSLYMLLVLATGLTLWIVYGSLQGDSVIIIANGVSLALLACLIGFKLREMIGGQRGKRRAATS